MAGHVSFELAEIRPSRQAVLKNQGMDPEIPASPKVEDLIQEALEILLKTSIPVGKTMAIQTGEFAAVFMGEGQNDDPTPLADIFPRADRLALFSLTLGPVISQSIEEHFSDNIALGYMLDAVASLTAENAVEQLEKRFATPGTPAGTEHALAYSPGYCGWHISGQKKLFEKLAPEEIGITLNTSCLMTPLKSVTGVLIAGKPAIHKFAPNFTFCRQCLTRSCIPRLKSLPQEKKGESN